MALAPAAAAGPGIFWANSGVMPAYKDVLPYSSYVKWYETYHIPDWMGAKNGAITAAWRYQSLDPDAVSPFLVTYKYPDISVMNAPEFMNVTLSHPSLPEGGPVTKFAKFTAMSGPHIETWKSGSTGDPRGPILVSEAIDPADNTTTEQFNEWYRQTYIIEISKMMGWRRTSRFDNGMGKPRWLTLHEFEDWAFENTTTKIASLLGDSQATKDMQKTSKKLELRIWKLMRVYGDGSTPWGEPWEDKIM